MIASINISPGLQNMVDQLDDLPTLPNVGIKMMALIDHQETSVPEIGNLSILPTGIR